MKPHEVALHGGSRAALSAAPERRGATLDHSQVLSGEERMMKACMEMANKSKELAIINEFVA